MCAKALPAVQIWPSRTTISSMRTRAAGATCASSAPSHHVVTQRRSSRSPAAARTNTAVQEAATSAPRSRAHISHLAATGTSAALSRSAISSAVAAPRPGVTTTSRGLARDNGCAAATRPPRKATRPSCETKRRSNVGLPRMRFAADTTSIVVPTELALARSRTGTSKPIMWRILQENCRFCRGLRGAGCGTLHLGTCSCSRTSKHPEGNDMPLMRVTLTPGAFDDTQKSRLAAALTEAGCRAESVPDRAESRMRALVLLNELGPQCFYSAGESAEAAVAGVFVDWQVSAGVLDGARKERFARELQEAAQSAADGNGSRM